MAEYNTLTTITMINTGTGPRLAYTYVTIDENGKTVKESLRGSLFLTRAQPDQMAAVETLKTFLENKLQNDEGTGVLKSFCTFRAAEGEKITYLYDVIDDNGQATKRNCQETLTLLELVAADQIAAVNTLRDFLTGKL